MHVTLGEDGSAGSNPIRPRRPPVDPDGNMGDWPPLRLPLSRSRRLRDGWSDGGADASPTAEVPPPPLRPGLRSLEELDGRKEDGAAPAAEEEPEVKQMKSSVPPVPRSKCFLRRMRGEDGRA
jgi:hypothetical protein